MKLIDPTSEFAQVLVIFFLPFITVIAIMVYLFKRIKAALYN